MHWSKVHSSSDRTDRTHTRVLQDTQPLVLLERVCSHPVCEASSCSTYTHSFPSPSSGPQCYKLSLRDFLALCFPPPFESLLSIYESLAAHSMCSYIDQSISTHHSHSLHLWLVPQRKKEKEWGVGVGQFQLTARSQLLLHLDFITNRPAPHSLQQKNNNHKGKNEKIKGGWKTSKRLVIQSVYLIFPLGREIKLWCWFCVSELNVNNLLLYFCI